MTSRTYIPTTLRRVAAAIGATAVAGLVAAPAATAATPNLVTNGDFAQPGVNGANPKGWALVNLGAETAPFKAAIATYDATGKFPPPAGIPGGEQFASEAFYQAGSSTGVEGIGGSQPLSGVTNATNAQVAYSVAETNYPDPSLASWAGSVFQVDFTSGATSYSLRYFNPFTPGATPYASAPTRAATVKYITGASLPNKAWFTAPTRNLTADIASQFGLSTFTVTGITYGDLENTTSAQGTNGAGKTIYPNETSYWAGIGLTQATPPPATPETPVAVMLPGAALGVLATGWMIRRRKSRSA